VARAQAAAGALDRRLVLAAIARQILDATADPDGRGLQLRGLEPKPIRRGDLEPIVVDGLLRLARVADAAGQALRDHPDPAVRRSAAVIAARAHPLLAGLYA
jgi:hypothetical protein